MKLKNVVNAGKCAVMINETLHDRNIREVVRKIDTYDSSIDAIVRIFDKKWILVDLKSRWEL